MKIHSSGALPLPVLAAAWLAALSPFTAGAGPVPKVSDMAPLFQGQDQDGKTWKLADAIGKKVVLLYLYPKDDTPGCTKEACGFRDRMADLKKDKV
jgi:peroxiredoxin Q/BCP